MFKYKSLTIVFCLFLFCNFCLASNHNNVIDEHKSLAFKDWINKRLDRFEIWREKQLKENEQKKYTQIDAWGNSETSDNLKSVNYSHNDKIKKVINYASNTETISVLLDKNESDLNAKKILQQHEKLFSTDSLNLKKATMTVEDVNFSSKEQRNEKKLILKQTQMQMNELDSQGEYLIMANTGLPESFIYKRIYEKKMKRLHDAKKRISKINVLYAKNRNNQKHNPDYKPKKIISFRINLLKNTLSERAEKFKKLALNKSNKWNIETPLIMAIMHTESAFRPNAKSNVPAYGLMQIVPSTAGRDVNKLINNIDAPMKTNDLYQPEINIETGTAYLHILNKRYLKKIVNPKSRLYCMISAYNTGAGNVARVFNADKSTNINKAFPMINNMSSEQVYQKLMDDLPYEETKSYLNNVYSRMKLYD